jgi:hypothetical protein
MTVTTAYYGNWTTHVGTLAEVSEALNLCHAQPDRTWAFSDGTNIVGIVYGG